ncbi:uncharacterized protein LOC110924665 [Helianthus annuus]|uniref:uncharacterized protein LOC110924665 n=1 Tax=Helianthus annuus TaxID=4232 RepID=UPI00165336C8|nr:uncharacterized protein LOC110924665 [Helianthus annuus]
MSASSVQTMSSGKKSDGEPPSLSLSFIDDLNPSKDMWNLKCRIIWKWVQSFRMDLILLDEKGRKIQAGIKAPLIPQFISQLHEDDFINFYRCTVVTSVNAWQGVDYGFNFIAHSHIVNGEGKDLLTCDVAGIVVWGEVVRCTLWNAYAQEFNDFLSQNSPNETVMAVIQHARIRKWQGQYTVQSDKFGSRLFLNQEIGEINDRRRSLLVKQFEAGASSSQTILSSQSAFNFVNVFYILSIEPVNKALSVISFKVHLTVQDETGSVSFVMFDKDAMKLIGSTANDIRERQVKVDDTESFPHEISRLVEKKLAFKIKISDYNLNHDYHVYIIQKVCDDPDIIAELVAGNGNALEVADELFSQEGSEIKVVQLSESSQMAGTDISKDVISVMADSSVVEAEKDSATSPNGKRSLQDVEGQNVGELSSNNKRNRRKPSRLNP